MNRRQALMIALLMFPIQDALAQPAAMHGAMMDPGYRQVAVDRARAEAAAQAKLIAEFRQKSGWVGPWLDADGNEVVVAGILPNGRPDLRVLLSTKATIGTAALVLQGPPFSLDGTGIRVGVWDGGLARTDHQEFSQTGTSRIEPGSDGATVHSHATAVSGVIAGGGVDSGALGAAPRATIESYDFADDVAEMLPRVAAGPDDRTGLSITNHSYGELHGWQSFTGPLGAGIYWLGAEWQADGSGIREDLKFGRYGIHAVTFDGMLYDAPYFVKVKSSGNDRTQQFNGLRDGTASFFYCPTEDCTTETWIAATAPHDDFWDNGGYDTMIDSANGKNVIAVGAITDPTTAGVRTPGTATMGAFSTWGPTDDGRVKPDFVALGVNARVPTSTTTVSYSNGGTGTSFSAPGVAGVIAMLVALIETEYDTRLRGSTLKGLLAHTATDMGRPGPDYQYGWGLPDGELAGTLVIDALADPAAHHLTEGLLTAEHPDDVFAVEHDGVGPLLATLCWYDPPAALTPWVLDNPTPVLINDLDLRIEGPTATVHMPWVLDVANPTVDATTGDNIVDTVEQVLVPAGAPAGTYLVRVGHKGALANDGQWYSLMISGQQPTGAPAPDPALGAADPPEGLLDTSVFLAVEGSNLQPGTRLVLVRSGFPDIPATNVFSAPGSIFGTVDLAGAEPGLWDIRVERPDGLNTSLSNGFTVVDPLGVRDWRDLGN